MKNIMVFGGADLQLSIIRKIKEQGIRAIVIDPDPSAIAQVDADKFFVVDGEDYDTTKKIALDENIHGIITTATDKPLKMMALLAKELDLKCFTEKAALLCTDKFLMKNALLEGGVKVADGYLIENYEDSKWFPCIIKPRDNSGSRGVIYCENRNDLYSALLSAKVYTRKDNLLVEEYISGKEYSVESIHWGNYTEVIQVTEKLVTVKPYNVELGHIQPTDLSASKMMRIKALITHMAKILDFKDCASHTEIKIDNEEIVLIESSPRLGGDYISSHLVPASTGIDLERLLISVSLGEQMPIINIKNFSAGIKYLELNEGTVTRFDEFELGEGVLLYKIDVSVGKIIEKIKNSLDRYGFIIVSGKNRAEVINRLDFNMLQIQSAIQIE